MMRKYFYRLFSFFLKDALGVFRQPLLLVSLIGGPTLVLALFGLTFRSPSPVLRAVLVWPEAGIPGIQRQMVEDMVEQNADLVAVVGDQDEGMRMLSNGQADLVQVVPADILQDLGTEAQPTIKIYAQTINPNIELWLQSLTYMNTTFINQQILLERIAQSQEDAQLVQEELRNMQEVFSNLETNLTPERKRQALETIDTLQRVLALPLVFLSAVETDRDDTNRELQRMHGEITSLLDDLRQLETAIQSDEVETQLARIREMDQKGVRLRDTLENYANIAPREIIFPVKSDYTNLEGKPYKMVVFYVPGVLALLIQHLGVALGSLDIVREQSRGAFELYRVLPVNTVQLILGKTMAYTLYLVLIAGGLLLLLPVFNVPVLSAYAPVFGLILLLSLASVGLGLLISTVSRSDTQAIQLTMILLLFAIFFTGFFMPLGSFSPLARAISKAIPVTHGLSGLQSLMLLGQPPEVSTWAWLALIVLVTYSLAYFGVRKRFM